MLTKAMKLSIAINEDNLIKYAEDEMRRAGLYDKDSDYGGMIPEQVIAMIKARGEGHSGGSHALVMNIFNKVANFKPLTPLTSNPDEWMEVTHMTANGESLHQSNRNPSVFSQDAGKTWYDIDDREKKNWPKKK